MCNPKEWPYIPGGDVCGTVESVPSNCNDFKVGDKVVATWDMFGLGGLAQYTKVNPKKTVKLPDGLSVEEGAALANSASHALKIVTRAKVKEGDRVLVLGGSGGVGTLIVQLLNNKNCSYVAATSTNEDLMKELGVDMVIDYTKGNWYEEKDWQTSKFDCIIDCAVGVRAWNSCNSVLKNRRAGGRFVAVVHNDWHISGKHYSDVFGMLLPPFGRQLYNVVRCTTPKYLVYLNEPSKESMAEVMELAGGGGSKKVLKLVLDPESPHPFTTQGVRDAWNKHIARKGHGKIVISVA